ncbi:histidine phosphatase family protein [Rhodococcus sp. NPDC058514]|uniref:histidine phosphatase family protein n=1 Tax=unclassified Rhodococcus (in: high G+C Gram-positive bacteria) TaxID=192944 RepID=UPI003648C551
MQLLLIRHALPERILSTDSTDGADPGLTDDGHAQAARLPDALAPYPISAIVSSPQRRALDTAAPVAVSRGLPVVVNAGLAEYDYRRTHYIPIHEAKAIAPDAYARILAGHFPGFVDEREFRSRVRDGLARVVAGADHEDTVAVFAHGGVINVYLQGLLGLDRPLTFPIDYASITRILVSRNGDARVASVNETGHVRDLLVRHRP